MIHGPSDSRLRAARRIPLFLAAAGLLMTGGGCSSWMNQPANVEATRTDVEALRTEQQELLRLVRELNARLDDQAESVASLRADSNVTLEELGRRLEVIQAQLEDQTGRPLPRTEPVSLGAPAADSTASPVLGAAPPPDAPAAPARDLYDAAYRDFSRGNYQLALEGFNEFLRYYPEDDLSDNAQYWIGECYYGLGDLDRAVLEYLKVRDLYPGADKVAAATLKTGYAFLRKGDEETARRYFETVVREFPDSDEANLARDKLGTLR